MSVIIRLQNLPWSANALDIRQFFNGLSIPEGGVHIVGGELGDAFIAFSTDEDARQAFNLNGGKIKEIQIKLMLSSRTEMQKVIEAARNPLAAFMQAAAAAPVQQVPQPLSTLIPTAVPAVVPEIKKDDSSSKDKDKRDRRRSRSRSRDRKDRDRDRDRRDRRRRDRSRSRSRDRRDRRRRDRSHSRDKRSRDRDRRSKDRRHSQEKPGSSSSNISNVQKEPIKIGVWEDPVRNEPQTALQQAQALLSTFLPTTNLEEARRNLNALAPANPLAPPSLVLGNRNGFQNQTDNTFNLPRTNTWNANPSLRTNDDRAGDFPRSRFSGNSPGLRIDDKFNTNHPRSLLNQPFGDNQRLGFGRSARPDRPNRFDTPERPGLLDRPSLDRSERSHDQPKNCCVQLRPYYGGYGEVRRFFHGSFIHNTGIKFINDEKGKRTGIVYIRFANPEGKENALTRNTGLLKNQAVEVEHLDDDIFDKTVDRYQPDHISEQDRGSPDSYKNNSSIGSISLTNFTCLAVEDLPLFTKEQDMLKIFSDYSLLSILLQNKQRHIIAYIKFSNPEDAKKAQLEKSKQVFDGQLLNIRSCSDEEFALISPDEPEENEQEIIEVEDDKMLISECVCLSGLPLKTTDRDISDFFSDVAIVPMKIHMVNSNLGFTGIAYCEFASTSDAEVALEKSGLPLGSGIVTVDSVEREEMESKLGVASVSNNMHMNRGPLRPPFFPRPFGRGGIRGMGMMGPRPPMRRFMHHPPGDPSDMAPPGHTVRMENVPYKAVLDEILDFFEGFDIPADNVLRRYNENGTPSGEAKVIFKAAEEAAQAVKERNYGKIRERTIYLHQC